MKPLRLLRWSGTVLSPRTRPCPIAAPCSFQPFPTYPLRSQSTASFTPPEPPQSDDSTRQRPPSTLQKPSTSPRPPNLSPAKRLRYPSPPPSQSHHSAKLAALHARLSLLPRLPLETLSRCLIDSTADADPRFNNTSLALLGASLLRYYTAEAILCRYPRLPTEVVFAAMWAYIGPRTLGTICREWGVEVAAEPGGEVDSGLLQCRRVERHKGEEGLVRVVDGEKGGSTRPNAGKGWRVGVSSKTVYDDAFGEEVLTSPADGEVEWGSGVKRIPLEDACAKFIQALTGAIYLHLGRKASKRFFDEHILSRHLDISRLFEFKSPTRDLAKLCAREGFASPVARIISETGRLSRSPVFVVGVFAGWEKLGEGQGASLNEARIRGAVGALKGWYLYSPVEVRVPSETEEGGRKWEAVMVDGGEIVA